MAYIGCPALTTNASFPRASWCTSVLSFGVFALAAGVSVLTTMPGRALPARSRRPATR